MSRPFLILAHPGHELRILGWVQREKPHVALFTDGSGSSQKPRIQRSVDILESMGCTLSSIRGLYSDKELYERVKEADFTFFEKLCSALFQELSSLGSTEVVSDMREGYSPSHDLAQAVAQVVVNRAQERSTQKFRHRTFPLTGAPGSSPDGKTALETLELSRNEFEFKLQTARRYTELAQEVAVLEKNGSLEIFRSECFFQVDEDILCDQYLSEEPYYESYGRAQVEKGVYKDLLTYENHIRPILIALQQGADS